MRENWPQFGRGPKIGSPKRTGAVRVGFDVRGPTQTDRFGPLRAPKWVGPLEMPLELECFKTGTPTDIFVVLGIECFHLKLAIVFIS
jgi:hypothetical protein